MFARLWRWPTAQEVRDAECLEDNVRRWWLALDANPKTHAQKAIYPIHESVALSAGLTTIAEPDDDGLLWYYRTTSGVREWTDRPLPGRTIKEGSYQYEARVTFFNDDGSCPDHTGKSGPFCSQFIRIKYRPGGYPLDRARLVAELTKRIRNQADELRQIVGVQQVGLVKANGSIESVRARETEQYVNDLAFRCGGCTVVTGDESGE